MKRVITYCSCLAILLLAACGVKKTAVPAEAEKASEPIAESHTSPSPSLEERIASGEFAWLDTIQIDTSLIAKIAGKYKLVYQKDLYGRSMKIDAVYADSLVLTPNGNYWLYKENRAVDYGIFNIRSYQQAIKICMENYKVDLSKGTYTDEVVLYDGDWGIWSSSQIYIDFHSYRQVLTTYLAHYGYQNEFILHFDVKLGDCYHHQWSGSNQIEWKKLK